MTQQYQISKEEVLAAWIAVKRSGSSGGYDGQEISDVEAHYKDELYKIWNRMASGSYMAKPVLQIAIPKVKGGVRILGIPTVTDRVAQRVIKNRMEVVLEPLFHGSSYGFRPERSAHDALEVCRRRCFNHKWVLDIDIEGFFDNLDHDLMLEMVDDYFEEPLIRLYVKRFLKADGIDQEGNKIVRTSGTPQGGVVSPLLANLYLHEAFDKWMKKTSPDLGFERYADDIIIHCNTYEQALYLKEKVELRLAKYKLSLHPDKTKIVYTGTDDPGDRKQRKIARKFTFLGYDFKPRGFKGRMVFTPAAGLGAFTMMRTKMRLWKLKSRIGMTLEDIAKEVNPVIRGWINYYGEYRKSALYKLKDDIDTILVRWLKKKHKSLKSHAQAWKELKQIARRNPGLFCHWHMIRLVPTRAV